MSKKVIYLEDAITAVNIGAFSARTIYGRTDEGRTALHETVKAIKALPSAQKRCRWTNKGVFYGDDVDAWQECECSKCGRWDTRPYMYYFDEPNYCSYCGAKRQKGGANE
jgi:hypothetical protein